MCSFDILLPIGGAVSLVFGVLFLCFRGVVLNFRGLDFNFTKVTILLHIPQYLFPFFQLLNSEAYRLRVVLRSPSDRIPSAARSDSVRRPIGFRPLHGGNVCRCARRKLSETTIYSAHYPHSLLYSCAKFC